MKKSFQHCNPTHKLMSGFKITEPDGSVYDHGDAVHTKKTRLVEAHKVACEELARARARYDADTKAIHHHLLHFVGHQQAFGQKLQALSKKQAKSSADYLEKRHKLAELECILEPSVHQQIAKYSGASSFIASSAPTSASASPPITTVADFTLLARTVFPEKK